MIFAQTLTVVVENGDFDHSILSPTFISWNSALSVCTSFPIQSVHLFVSIWTHRFLFIVWVIIHCLYYLF